MRWLPNWLRVPLTVGLGLIFRNNKLPVDLASDVVNGMYSPNPNTPVPPLPVPQKPRDDTPVSLTLDDPDGAVQLELPMEQPKKDETTATTTTTTAPTTETP